MIYAKISRGFRSGGQNLRASSAITFVPFQPETVNEIEVGTKNQFFHRRLRLNVAAYRSKLKDAQRTTFQFNAANSQLFTILGNAAGVRVWGLEADATAILFEGFQLSANGSLTKPKYTKYSEAPTPQNPTGDRRAERFDGVPEKTFSLTANYERDVDVGRLRLNVNYSWQSKTPLFSWNNPLDPNNAALIAATTTPAGGIWNARAGLQFDDGRYEVAVFGRNLGNNRDIVTALVIDPFGYSSGIRREPRTYGVELKFDF